MNVRTNCAEDNVSNNSLNYSWQTYPLEVDFGNFPANPYLSTNSGCKKEMAEIPYYIPERTKKFNFERNEHLSHCQILTNNTRSQWIFYL